MVIKIIVVPQGVIYSHCRTFAAGMCPFVSITVMWLCVLYVLVHNNECVEQTVLVQTYTEDNTAKSSCSGGVWGQAF